MMDNSIEIEQSVIGSLLAINDPDSELASKAMSLIKPSSFGQPKHRNIYKAIKSLALKSEPISLITVDAELKKIGITQDHFGYLAEIQNNTFSASNVIAYAKLLREASLERYTVQKLNEALGMFNDKDNGDVYQRIGLAESLVGSISDVSLYDGKGGLKHVAEAAGKWIDNIEQIHQDGYDKNRYSTGIESLDDVLGVKGMRKGSLVGVGARPKMGKSAFMMLLANHFAIELKVPACIFSMEMPDQDIFERAMTNRAMTDPYDFYRRNPRNESVARRDMAFSDIVSSQMFIDDTPALTLSHIQKESRRIRKEQGELGIICVDYLTLMEGEKAERNDLAYGAITKGLKNLAKELDCVVLLLTQLNRGLESRTDKRPMPSDSRDTGQIEQDVDLWIGLYKESVYKEEVYSPGMTELIVRLNRHGGVGTAFVDMRQGYHFPLSIEEGAKIIAQREAQILEAEQESKSKRTYKRSS